MGAEFCPSFAHLGEIGDSLICRIFLFSALFKNRLN